MTNNSEILIEMEGIAPLLAADKIGVPFKVPDDYFAFFADYMLNKIQAGKKTFSVPEGYFEGFADQMMLKVRANEISAELEEIAPSLNKVSKKMPFNIPEGYFENLAWPVEREKIQKKARVFSIFGGRAARWAAAAAIILTIGLSWMYFSKQITNPELSTTIPVTQVELDSLLNQMEVGNLSNALEQEGASIEFTNLLIAAQEGVEKSVQKLSTEELNVYLENYTIPESGS